MILETAVLSDHGQGCDFHHVVSSDREREKERETHTQLYRRGAERECKREKKRESVWLTDTEQSTVAQVVMADRLTSLGVIVTVLSSMKPRPAVGQKDQPFIIAKLKCNQRRTNRSIKLCFLIGPLVFQGWSSSFRRQVSTVSCVGCSTPMRRQPRPHTVAAPSTIGTCRQVNILYTRKKVLKG